MKFVIIAVAMRICLASCLAANASYPALCSAFNKQGDQVRATFLRPHLSLQITAAGSNNSTTLSTVADDAGLVSCSVFFDRDNRNVAVGLNDLELKPGPLFVVVADLGTGKLVSNFTVSASAAMGDSLELVGFLQGGSDLVVLGSGAPDQATKVFSTALFRVTGEQENPPENRTLPADAEGGANVWFKTFPQFCPLRSVPLVGDAPEGERVDEANAQAACDVVSAIAYPDGNTLITATSREPNDLITSVDFTAHSAQQLTLPATGGYGSYTSVGRGTLSPDGQVFAVSRILLSNSFLGDAHSKGTEVDIVQVSPLKIIRKVRLKPDFDPASLSIDHRNGTVTVLSFQGGRWESKPLKVQ